MSSKLSYIIEVLDQYSVNTKSFKTQLDQIKKSALSLDKTLAKTNLSFKNFASSQSLTRTIQQTDKLARSLERVKLNAKGIGGFSKGSLMTGESMALMNSNLKQMMMLNDRMMARMNRAYTSDTGGRSPMPTKSSPRGRGLGYVGGGLGSFGGVAKAMGYYALIDEAIQMPREVFNVRREMDGLGATLEAVLPKYEKNIDSTVLAAKETEYLKNKTYELGLDFRKTKEEYVKFLASGSMTGRNLGQMRGIFEAFAKISTVYQLPADRFKLVMNAITQMTSKTVVSMEELKRQLADSLPGALDIFARAAMKARPDIVKSMGDFMKMVEQGKVSADILLSVMDVINEDPELTKGLALALDSLNAKTNRLSHSWTMFLESLSKGETGKLITSGVTGMDKMFKSMATSGESLAKSIGEVKSSFQIIGETKFGKVISAMAGGLADVMTEGTATLVKLPFKLAHEGGRMIAATSLGMSPMDIEEFNNNISKFYGLDNSYSDMSYKSYRSDLKAQNQTQKVIVELIGSNLPNNMSIAPRNETNNIRVDVKRGMTLSPL